MSIDTSIILQLKKTLVDIMTIFILTYSNIRWQLIKQLKTNDHHSKKVIAKQSVAKLRTLWKQKLMAFFDYSECMECGCGKLYLIGTMMKNGGDM